MPEVGETEAEVEEVENARAWIGAAPPARSGSPPPDLPICAVRASFPAPPYPPVIHCRNRHRLPGEDGRVTAVAARWGGTSGMVESR